MLEDLEALGQAYLDAVSELPQELAPAQPSADDKQKNVDAMIGDLETDCHAAAARVQEGFRALLAVVLLSSQDHKAQQAGS